MRTIVRYWRAVMVAVIPAIVYIIPRELIFTDDHPLCIIRNITGHPCPGCGMTRALVSLCYFDFSVAWTYNRGVIVVAPLLLYIWVKWIIRLVKQAK